MTDETSTALVVSMLQAGFITARSSGIDQEYHLVVKFPTLEALQRAHNALVTAAPRAHSDTDHTKLARRLRIAAKALFRERVTFAEDLDTIAEVVTALEALATQPKIEPVAHVVEAPYSGKAVCWHSDVPLGTQLYAGVPPTQTPTEKTS